MESRVTAKTLTHPAFGEFEISSRGARFSIRCLSGRPSSVEKFGFETLADAEDALTAALTMLEATLPLETQWVETQHQIDTIHEAAMALMEHWKS